VQAGPWGSAAPLVCLLFQDAVPMQLQCVLQFRRAKQAAGRFCWSVFCIYFLTSLLRSALRTLYSTGRRAKMRPVQKTISLQTLGGEDHVGVACQEQQSVQLHA
jgi:hypothetical protein